MGWNPYQKHIATPEELEGLFSQNGYGIGIVAGKVSGNLEVLDFDEPTVFEPWEELVKALGGAELLNKLSIVGTPTRGYHVSYCCPDGIERNQKLAQRKVKGERPKVLIETRGEGGYVIVPGSPAACHPLKKVYKQLNGSLTDIPIITGEERELLLNACRALNEYIKPAQIVTGRGEVSDNRPGDDFNARAQWEEILEPWGWKKVGSRGEATDWQRPSKTVGSSATVLFGRCQSWELQQGVIMSLIAASMVSKETRS